jgi:xylose isomerase
MKHLKHSVMISLLGRQADRFHEYQPARPLSERLDLAGQVQGVQGIEVVYPDDFADMAASAAAIKQCGLPVSAVNLNVKGHKKWQAGSFTSPDARLRAEAVADLKLAMDLAVELDSAMVTCCPLIDGHNYSFQVDYDRQWTWLEEGIAQAARHRADVKLSLEYKLKESRNYVILGDMGRALYLCQRLGLPNVGVTLDVGHALLAGETPAEMACLAARSGRLFYVHFNDNGREWDWDMLPGSVNCWDLVETLFYLDRLGWRGWLSYDVLTRNGDPVEQMNATIAIMEAAERLLDEIGRDHLEACIREGIPAQTFRQLWERLL